MNEILLFTFNLNRQKINIKLQKIKTAMLKTYAMIENSHMLLIVNQINQLLDENTKIVKINTNIISPHHYQPNHQAPTNYPALIYCRVATRRLFLIEG